MPEKVEKFFTIEDNIMVMRRTRAHRAGMDSTARICLI
jgi:hypothetical protein